MNLRFVLIALIAFFIPVLPVHAANIWEPPYVGSDTKLLYLPDANAVYWRYGWKRQPQDNGGVVITGEMPHARYFSYNVYDDDTKSSVGSFADFQLDPDDGSNNPFTGKPANGSLKYTIHIVPEGTKLDAKNLLYFPRDIENVSVFLRHYLPQGGIEGGVAMPVIEAFDPATGNIAPAPESSKIPKLSKEEAEKYLLPMLKDMVKQAETDPDALIDRLHDHRSNEPFDMKELIATRLLSTTFDLYEPGKTAVSFRFQTSGTYPNGDNYYLGLPVVRTANQVLVTRFRAPQFAENQSENPTAAVRYFSLNQGDENSYNLASQFDQEMKVAADGFVYHVIGDTGIGLEEKAEALGANFMPWKTREKMLLIYRQMLPRSDFMQGIDKVPPYDPGKPASGQDASLSIGDHAITGRLMDPAELMSMTSLQGL